MLCHCNKKIIYKGEWAVQSGRLSTTKVMAKKRSKKNCNYKNYNHNNHRNCNSNNKEPDIEITKASHKQLLNYSPSVVDKSLFKTVSLYYSEYNEGDIEKHTETICFKDIDFDFRDSGEKSSMTLSFENEHRFWNEMITKFMPLTEKKVIYPSPLFVIETFNGTELVSKYTILADNIRVKGCTLVVYYSTSFIMTND